MKTVKLGTTTMVFVFAPLSLLGLYGFHSLPPGGLSLAGIWNRGEELVNPPPPPPPPPEPTHFDTAKALAEVMRRDVETAQERYGIVKIEEGETERKMKETEGTLANELHQLSIIDAKLAVGDYTHPILGYIGAQRMKEQGEIRLREIKDLQQEASDLQDHLVFIQGLLEEVADEALRGPRALADIERKIHLLAQRKKYQGEREQLLGLLGGAPRNFSETVNAVQVALRKAENEVSPMNPNHGKLDFAVSQECDLRSRISAILPNSDNPPVAATASTTVALDFRQAE